MFAKFLTPCIGAANLSLFDWQSRREHCREDLGETKLFDDARGENIRCEKLFLKRENNEPKNCQLLRSAHSAEYVTESIN